MANDEPEVQPLTTQERLYLEDLADKLLDKKEKFAYFLITAVTAVIAFTFNDFNNRAGVLRDAPVWLVGLGWLAMILSSVLPLYVIRTRQSAYAQNLNILQSGRKEATQQEAERFETLARRSELAERIGSALFVSGLLLLALSYVVGLD